MVVLVTGGTGFIGRRLLALGLRDRRKVVLSRRAPESFSRGRAEGPRRRDSSVRFVRCDLRDFKGVGAVFRRHPVDVVVHLASAGVAEGEGGEIWETNVLGTLNLLEAAAGRGVSRFIHIGSYFERFGPAIAAETPRGALRRAYAATKAAQAALVAEFDARRGLPALILRLFSVYGPGEPEGRLFPALLKAAIRGEGVDLSPGGRKRDYVFVDDVVRAIDRAVRAPRFPRGRALDIARGEALSVREVVGLLRRKPYAARGFAPRFGRRPYDAADVPRAAGSPEEARRFLRWEARVTVSQGLDLFHQELTRA